MIKSAGMTVITGALYSAAHHATYTAGGTNYTASFSDKAQTDNGIVFHFILPATNINGKRITKVGVANSSGGALAEKALDLPGGSSDVTYQYLINIAAEDE